MVCPINPNVRIFAEAEKLSRAIAQSLVDRINATVIGGRHFYLALSGGNTPRLVYRRLAAEYRNEIPLAQVHLFWGDERYVPPGDPRSNYHLARETLLDHVPIPTRNVHPMPTDFPDPEDAAQAYERVLGNYFSPPWPRFDLVLLGLGADGHTASLFPGSAALQEKKRWVVAVRGPAEPRQRLTLTLPVLTHAAQIYFLVAGAEKAEGLRRTLTDAPDLESCPAAGVSLSQRAIVWWTDEAAAALFQKARGSRSTSI